MKYEVTFANQIKVLRYHLIGVGLALILLFFFFRYDNVTMTVFLIAIGVFTLPVVILHLGYLSKNAGQQVEILEDGIVLHLKDKTVKKYSITDLQKIVVYKSASLDKNGIPLTGLDFYHYARIIPKVGDDIIFTCLMAPDVEKAVRYIRAIPFERKKWALLLPLL